MRPTSTTAARASTTTSLTSSARAACNWPLLPRRCAPARHLRAAASFASPFVAARAAAPAPSSSRLVVSTHSSARTPFTRRAAAPSDQSAAAPTSAMPPPPASSPTATPTTATVVVFTTPACPYCRKAKALLQSRSVPYVEVDVELSSAGPDQARALRAAVAAASGGRRTVPQIFVGSAHVGGSDDLEAADLQALLDAPSAREPLPAALAAAVAAAEEAVAAAAAKGAGATATEPPPLTLADRAEPGVRAAYLALLEATSGAAVSGPALAALAAARKRTGEEAARAAAAKAGAAAAAFDGEDAAEQRAADAVYAAAAARADPEAAADNSAADVSDLAASFSGLELVAALAELQKAGALPPSASASSSSLVALARALVRSNLVNVAGATRRPDPTDTTACRRFFDVTPTKPFRLLEDTLALARAEAERGATAAAASRSPLQLLLGKKPAPPPPDYKRARPLNAPFWWAGEARPAAVVAEDVRARVVRLYDRHLKLQASGKATTTSGVGGGGASGGASASPAANAKTVVSYTSLRRDRAFWDEYVCTAAELQAVKGLDKLDRNTLAALAINLYNALVVHALAVYGPRRALGSAAARLAFFQRGARYLIGGGGAKKPSPSSSSSSSSAATATSPEASSVLWGGSVYTCDDLEHGVLRGNRPGAAAPTMLLGLGLFGARFFARFKPNDPRISAIVPPPVDARIHFALVCGAQSCPPIRTYSAATLDEGLEAAAEAFCASSVRLEEGKIDPGKAALPPVTVRMSKIFGWYYPDFGPTKAERLRWLLPYVSPEARAALKGVLARDPAARSVRLVYDPYDWTANAAEEGEEE